MPDEEEPTVAVVAHVAFPSLKVTLTIRPPNRKQRRANKVVQLAPAVVITPGVITTLKHPYIEAPIPVERIVRLAREQFNDGRVGAVEIWVDQPERYRWSLMTRNMNDANNGGTNG